MLLGKPVYTTLRSIEEMQGTNVNKENEKHLAT